MSLNGRSVLIVLSLSAAGALLAGCSGSSATSSGGLPLLPTKHASSPGGALSSGASGVPAAGDGGTRTPALSRPGQVGETIAPAAPLVIRNGTVTLKVAKGGVVDAFNRISSAAESLGGFVASSSGNGAGDAGGASIVVRVPSNGFEALVSRVDRLGKVEAESQSGQAVTAESVNLLARIDNLKAEETSLRTLLSRAGSIPAILQVQDQLFGVEGDIEQLSAQEGSLIDQATFATLTVELSPRAAPPPNRPKRPRENAVVRALKLAAHNTAVAARDIALALGWAFPLLVLGLVLFGAWRLRRRMTRRRPPAPSAPGIS